MDLYHCPVVISQDLQNLANQILDNSKIYFSENNELSDSHLIELHSVYGDILEKALVLLEESVFICYMTAHKAFKVYQVRGSSGTRYILYPDLNFCECSAYKYQICKSDPAYLTCKHVLAAKLAEITGKFKEETVSVSYLIEVMLNNSEIK